MWESCHMDKTIGGLWPLRQATMNAWPWQLSTLMHLRTPLGNAAIVVYRTHHRFLTRVLAQQADILGHRPTLQPVMNHIPSGREDPSGDWKCTISTFKVYDEHDIDIAISTEAYLTPFIQTSEFLSEQYNAIRCDFLWLRGLNCYSQKGPDCMGTQISQRFWILISEVSVSGKEVRNSGRQPSGDVTNIENITRHIDEMVEKHWCQPIWIAGDLKLMDIDWEGLSISGHQCLKAINQTFLQTLEGSDLEQVIDFPTRMAAIGNWAYLDLLITNRPGLLHKYPATPGIRDHTSTINAEIDCFAQVKCQVISWVTKSRTWNPILYANHLHHFAHWCQHQHHDFNEVHRFIVNMFDCSKTFYCNFTRPYQGAK